MRSGAILLVGLGLGALPALSPGAGELHAQEEDRAEDRAERISRVLVASGARGSYLGVRIQDVDDGDVERLGLPEERGALVAEVLEGTPAEEAGLREDDVVVAWNGERVESVAELRRHLRETPTGRSVRLTVVREGGERQVELTTEERSGSLGRTLRLRPERMEMRERMGEMRDRLRERAREEGRVRVAPFTFFGRPRLGVSLHSLSDQLADYFGVEEGALVASVEEDSPAEAAGLRAGDVILSVGGEEVEDPGDVVRALADREAGQVEIRVMRDGSERTLTAELEEPEESTGLMRGSGRVWVAPGGGEEGWRWWGDGVRVRVPRIEVETAPFRFHLPRVEVEAEPFRFHVPRVEVEAPVPPVEVETAALPARSWRHVHLAEIPPAWRPALRALRDAFEGR